MRVLVTGASSLLGNATVRCLVERGDDVTCFQRTPSGLDAREVLGDVRDRAAVLAAAAGPTGSCTSLRSSGRAPPIGMPTT